MIKRTLLCGALAALVAPTLHAIELSFIRGPLEKNATVDPDACGYVRSQFKTGYARMYANLHGLTPDTPYQFTVDGAVEADFVTDADGRACVQFHPAATGSQVELDFDPRGKEVAVTDGTDVVLSMIYSGEGEPTELVVDERTTLVRAESVASGRVEARYLDQKNKSRFILHFLGLDRGIYTLRVDGVDLTTVDLSKGRSAQVRFEANKFGALKKGHGKDKGNGKGNGKGKGNSGGKGNGKGPKNRHSLDFDPRGKLVEVLAEDGSVSFSGLMQANIDVLPVDTDDTIILTPVDPASTATGSADVVIDEAGETTLTISAQGLPIGDYEVWIGAANRGTLTIADDGAGGTTGTIVFATLTTGTEIPLDFPIAGTVEIQQAGVVFLTGSLD